jgi:hypothetical protein
MHLASHLGYDHMLSQAVTIESHEGYDHCMYPAYNHVYSLQGYDKNCTG